MYCLLQSGLRKIVKLLSGIKLKHICIGFGLIVVFDFFGVFTHVFEKPFDENFVYPYKGDVHEFVAALRHNQQPVVPPINVYNHTFIHDAGDKCSDSDFQTLRIVLLVKSAVENTARRMAIRHSWGFEKRFSDVPMRVIFLLGVHSLHDIEVGANIDAESIKYRDIVQANFLDSYYNNTIKTMMGFQWAHKYCSNSKYYMFVDDDMYVSVKNVLRFLRNPALYPEYLRDDVKFDKRAVDHSVDRMRRSLDDSLQQQQQQQQQQQYSDNQKNGSKTNVALLDKIKNVTRPRNASESRRRRQVFDFELPDDVRLFAGFVFTSAPHRHKSSKWYVSLKEYPYHLWPPYVTAGAYILSKEALLDMYFASMYTKHFRFDDIFLALVAKKVDIEPFHCEEFHFYKKDYTKYNYKYVISSHGYGDPEELLQVWNEQKALGNA